MINISHTQEITKIHEEDKGNQQKKIEPIANA